MIPPFDARGLLPPGVHAAPWDEFSVRFGGTARRKALLAGLREALVSLRDAGCALAYVDGSFVTAKPEPGDFDACWGIKGVVPELLDPALLDFSDGRAAQKARYGGELFPAELPEGVSGRTFLEFFYLGVLPGGPGDGPAQGHRLARHDLARPGGTRPGQAGRRGRRRMTRRITRLIEAYEAN